MFVEYSVADRRKALALIGSALAALTASATVRAEQRDVVLSAVIGEPGYDNPKLHKVDKIFVDGKLFEKCVVRLDTRAGFLDYYTDGEIYTSLCKGLREYYTTARVYGKIEVTWKLS